MVKSVVIVNTSAGAMGGNPTGLWLSELADPYYALTEAGLEVTIASIAGGARRGKHCFAGARPGRAGLPSGSRVF